MCTDTISNNEIYAISDKEIYGIEKVLPMGKERMWLGALGSPLNCHRSIGESYSLILFVVVPR